MDSLYIPLRLLNLTKQEAELLITLYLIYENKGKELYKIEEIAVLMGFKKDSPVIKDLLNRLMIKNIIGRIIYSGIINPKILQGFDQDFLNTLYDKKNPLESAKQKAGYYIKDITEVYVLNPSIKSWKYLPKIKVVRTLKKLKKVMNNDFIDYLLKSFGDNDGNNKRKQFNLRLNGWNIWDSMNAFMKKYKIRYGNDYIINNDNREQKHMKDLLMQFSKNNMSKDKFDPFLDYAFDEAINKDYVLKIVGLKYYANEYLIRVGAK